MSQDIILKLQSARVSDSPLNLINLITTSILEIQTLRSLAEDMYVTLINEIGETSVSTKYEIYMDVING